MLYIFSSQGFSKSFAKCCLMNIKYHSDLLNTLAHAQSRLFKAIFNEESWPRHPPSCSFCIQELAKAPQVPHTLQASPQQHWDLCASSSSSERALLLSSMAWIFMSAWWLETMLPLHKQHSKHWRVVPNFFMNGLPVTRAPRKARSMCSPGCHPTGAGCSWAQQQALLIFAS